MPRGSSRAGLPPGWGQW